MKYRHIPYVLDIASLLLIGAVAVLLSSAGCIITHDLDSTTTKQATQPTNPQDLNLGKSSEESTVYLIYSPLCPHCHALLSYLPTIRDKYKNVIIINSTDGREYAYYLYTTFGYEWDGGVPFLFAVLENGTLIAVEGFVEGGVEEYEKICNTIGWKKSYHNKTLLCTSTNTPLILGSPTAVEYLLSLCTKKRCIRAL